MVIQESALFHKDQALPRIRSKFQSGMSWFSKRRRHAAILDSVVVVVSREVIADWSAGSLEEDVGQVNASNTELIQGGVENSVRK